MDKILLKTGLKASLTMILIAIVSIIILCCCISAFAETASWYGNESIVPKWGGYTANGSKFNENALTCAVPKRSMMNHWYKVTNLRNGKSIIVYANDTGSFAKYGRDIDLSKRAFKEISSLKKGVIAVKIEKLKGGDLI